MSLKAFHILFVTLSSLLGFGFGAWALAAYARGAGIDRLVMGVCSLLLGAALVVYGVWFARKIRTREEENERRRKLFHTLPVTLLIWALAGRDAAACSACYGQADGAMIDAARLGVWLLFGLVFAVQFGLVGFFFVLRRRAKNYERTMAGGGLGDPPGSR